MYTAKSYLASIVPDSGPKDEIWQHIWLPPKLDKSVNTHLGRLHIIVWKASFFYILWSCWLFRNVIIFKGLKMDAAHLFDLCILRLSWWCTAKWPASGISINDLICCPSNFSTFSIAQEVAVNFVLLTPAKGELKFNVDGVVTGSFGEAGNSGCLLNEDTRCLAIFQNQ
ncbi:hypothetical protein GQ457_09G017040 [Hibiscus cannabinus]